MRTFYTCAECQQQIIFSNGDFWETPTKGTYEFLCTKCSNQILKESR